MATFDEIAALRGVSEIDSILQRVSALSLYDSVYEIYRSRFTLARHELSAGITDPRPYVFQESPLFCWMKFANPEAADDAIVGAYETTRQMERAYDRCAEEVTEQVDTQVPVSTRMSMVVDLLWSRFPMFSKTTIERVNYEWFLGNR
ncbi:hypothetical protein [Ensifer sp. MJa1]|uniref:hypothetical protein n=1 Tax=Ensifer sp. MJa1 TaxID=2919888 RepID=UPI003009B5B3